MFQVLPLAIPEILKIRPFGNLDAESTVQFSLKSFKIFLEGNIVPEILDTLFENLDALRIPGLS